MIVIDHRLRTGGMGVTNRRRRRASAWALSLGREVPFDLNE